MKTKIFLFIFLSCLLSCQNNNDFPGVQEEDPSSIPLIPRQDIKLSAVEQELSATTNRFAFNLFKQIYKEDAQKNILISPLSASLAFSMLNNGAAGSTQEEIEQTLGFGNVSREEINIYMQKLVEAMKTLDPRGIFESANSIWIQNEFPVLDAFKQVNRKYYEAEIQNVDFNNPATLKTINNWVSNKTHGKIPTILDELPFLSYFYLINALYFKGYWSDPFDIKETVDAAFRTSEGSVQKVPTMRKVTSRYAKVGNCSAVELPFGNKAFSLVVVLPEEGTPLTDVVEKIDDDWWDQISDFDGFAHDLALEKQKYSVHLEIPRFKIEYERMLNNDLKALGMKAPFDSKECNLSLISQSKLFINLVKQKTFAQLDENGMEAAAVTIIMTYGATNLLEIEIDFKVDRPFLYFIKEKSTNLVFFAGVINKI